MDIERIVVVPCACSVLVVILVPNVLLFHPEDLFLELLNNKVPLGRTRFEFSSPCRTILAHPKRLTLLQNIWPLGLSVPYIAFACPEPFSSSHPLTHLTNSHPDRSGPLTGAPSSPFPLIASFHSIVAVIAQRSTTRSLSIRLCSGSTTRQYAFITHLWHPAGLHTNESELRGGREGMASEKDSIRCTERKYP